jgi:hypothetical protein
VRGGSLDGTIPWNDPLWWAAILAVLALAAVLAFVLWRGWRQFYKET